jgi:hypothetical protein
MQGSCEAFTTKLPSRPSALNQHDMSKRTRNHGESASKVSSESPSVDNAIVFERPVKTRRSNIYEAVTGKQVYKVSESTQANVVEGNVTRAGRIGNITDVKASTQSLRPDEVLFKQKNAPIRYEETDYYFDHANLPAEQPLPPGELLSTLHAYIAKLYSRTECFEMEKVWKCMDGTALIAFGILMEETVREALGETGDFAFTEAADEEEERVLADGDEQDSDDKPVISARHEEQEGADFSSSSEDGSRYSTDDSE